MTANIRSTRIPYSKLTLIIWDVQEDSEKVIYRNSFAAFFENLTGRFKVFLSGDPSKIRTSTQVYVSECYSKISTFTFIYDSLCIGVDKDTFSGTELETFSRCCENWFPYVLGLLIYL